MSDSPDLWRLDTSAPRCRNGTRGRLALIKLSYRAGACTPLAFDVEGVARLRESIPQTETAKQALRSANLFDLHSSLSGPEPALTTGEMYRCGLPSAAPYLADVIVLCRERSRYRLEEARL